MSCNGWKEVILEEICSYENSRVPVSELNSCNYISTENMQPNKGGVTYASSLPTVDYVTRYTKGQTLISNIRPYFKKIWSADKDGGCSNDILCFRLKNDVDSNFFYYQLSQDLFFDYVMSGAKGTKMPRGDKQQIMKYIFVCPPMSDQKKIVAILSSFDDKIELNNKINTNLEQQAQAIFKSWFVDFEPFKDGEFVDSELGMIPKGWRVAKLSELCRSISKTHDFKKEQLIFLNTGDIDKGIFLHKNYSWVKGLPGQAKKSINSRDVLYSEIRPINSHYAYVDFDPSDYVVSTKLMVIRSSGIDSRRLYQYLTSKSVINILQAEAESRSGTFPQIRFENIQNLSIILATNMVEEKYSRIINSFYKKIDANVLENDKLSNLRDTLLPKLMSGEIEV